MGTILFEHNQRAYEAVLSMLGRTGKAAVIHPTGTGKSFIAFQFCEEHAKETVCWLSPSGYIFRTQKEKWCQAGGGKIKNIRFFTYAKLMRMRSLRQSSRTILYLMSFTAVGLGSGEMG